MNIQPLPASLPCQEKNDLVIEHEVGAQLGYGVLGGNWRTRAWMDEGMGYYLITGMKNEISCTFPSGFNTGLPFFANGGSGGFGRLVIAAHRFHKKTSPLKPLQKNFQH